MTRKRKCAEPRKIPKHQPDVSACLHNAQTTKTDLELEPFSSPPPSPGSFTPSTLVERNRELEQRLYDSIFDETDELFDDCSPDQDGGIRGPIKRRKKNYKSLTREKRVEANARERVRVQTIGVAFDQLRRAVPSYSSNQRLSKLAILKVATCYIQLLSKMAGLTCVPGIEKVTASDCVRICTHTIQGEVKPKRGAHFVAE